MITQEQINSLPVDALLQLGANPTLTEIVDGELIFHNFINPFYEWMSTHDLFNPLLLMTELNNRMQADNKIIESLYNTSFKDKELKSICKDLDLNRHARVKLVSKMLNALLFLLKEEFELWRTQNLNKQNEIIQNEIENKKTGVPKRK